MGKGSQSTERIISPRKFKSSISDKTPRYWFDNHPYKTHFFNAFSSIFPVGERFFVKSVRYYEEEVDSPALKADIRGFVAQESRHSVEHERHFKCLVKQGYDGIRNIESANRILLDKLNKWFPRFALAETVSLEHLTAILSNACLSDPERWLNPMHEDLRSLWHWHAVEETEHKSVAFDVYQEINGGYALRVCAMFAATFAILFEVFIRTSYMLWKDGKFWDHRLWLEGIGFVWGRGGVVASVFDDYLKFYHRDFSPWQNNNYHYVEEFEEGVDQSR